MSFRQVEPLGMVRMVPNTSDSDSVVAARRQPCARASACAAAASSDALSAVAAFTGLSMDVHLWGPRAIERWVRFPRQFGGLAKVDSGFDYAASFSACSSIA